MLADSLVPWPKRSSSASSATTANTVTTTRRAQSPKAVDRVSTGRSEKNSRTRLRIPYGRPYPCRAPFRTAPEPGRPSAMATTAPPAPGLQRHGPFAGYAPAEHRPLGSYAVLTGAFGAALAGTLLGLRAAGRELPERPSAADIALAGVATHKLSRLLAKDKVTSFLRAPFTRYQEPGPPGEIEEQARGTGMRLAIGELAICPYCLSQWVAAAFACGLVAAPRTTRFVA